MPTLCMFHRTSFNNFGFWPLGTASAVWPQSGIFLIPRAGARGCASVRRDDGRRHRNTSKS